VSDFNPTVFRLIDLALEVVQELTWLTYEENVQYAMRPGDE
jgi:hypothetical protein